MSITIQLSDKSLKARDEVLKAKAVDIKARGVASRFVVADTPNAEIQGLTAEAAWAEIMDVPYVYKPYDPLQDDVAGIQVRSSKSQNAHLIIYKKDVPGVYVLGIVNDDYTIVEFVGWSTYKRVVQPANYKTQLGSYTLKIPAYCVKQSQLKSFLDWPPRPEVAHGAF